MKMLMITGVTGFLGGAVLEKILTSDQSVKLLLLARASDQQSGLERVLENMRKFNVPEDKLATLSVDNILIGDLSQPEAFLNDPRLDQVTHVVNCAAVASFGNNRFIWSRSAWNAGTGAPHGAGFNATTLPPRGHGNVMYAGAGFPGRRKRRIQREC